MPSNQSHRMFTGNRRQGDPLLPIPRDGMEAESQPIQEGSDELLSIKSRASSLILGGCAFGVEYDIYCAEHHG
jgi:hypothetical protein